jgi:hypothetical protein
LNGVPAFFAENKPRPGSLWDVASNL